MPRHTTASSARCTAQSVYRVGYRPDGLGIVLQYPAGESYIPLLRSHQTDHAAELVSFSMGTRSLPREESGQSVRLTSYLHLVPRLRTSGETSTLACDLITFMATNICRNAQTLKNLEEPPHTSRRQNADMKLLQC